MYHLHVLQELLYIPYLPGLFRNEAQPVIPGLRVRSERPRQQQEEFPVFAAAQPYKRLCRFGALVRVFKRAMNGAQPVPASGEHYQLGGLSASQKEQRRQRRRAGLLEHSHL